MRILYVSKESPLQPSGGIGTYVDHMARAMAAAGHEVFLFTWVDSKEFRAVVDYGPFKPEHVHVERIERSSVWRNAPIREYGLSLSTFLKDPLLKIIDRWGIDVVEGTDFLSPVLPLFQALQTSARGRDLLCVTYNHGFIEDFYEADQIAMTPAVQTELLGERQQCRLSDVVVTPSEAAKARLAAYDIRDHVSVVREPYRMERRAPLGGVRHDITYFGRISISKGIDRLIHFANATQPVLDWRQIKLVGRIIDTPFRVNDMRDYVHKRLAPTLREVTFFTDFLPRDRALRLLEPGAVCPSLGSAETFSYACVESLDYGLLPVVRHGTPMAEFIPQEHRDIILDERFRSVREIQATFERLLTKADQVVEDTREHCEATLAPEKIAQDMTDLYAAQLEAKRGRRVARQTARMGLDDVTVLMPIHGAARQMTETIDSLAQQTVGLPRVLIVDDGTPEDRSEWFAYAETALPDCHVIRTPNSGLLGARNTLIDAAPSDISLFLDDDDRLHPRALERMLEAWNDGTFDVDAVLPQRVNFGESKEPIMRDLMGDHLHVIANDYRMTALIRTEVLREIGFDGARRNGEGDDWVFWLRFHGFGHRAAVVPELLFFYRFREGSMSWPWSEGQDVGTQAMVREAMTDICAHDPSKSQMLARALYASKIRKAPEKPPSRFQIVDDS